MPLNATFSLYRKLKTFGVKSLTKEEKERIAAIAVSQNGIYKCGGFAAHFDKEAGLDRFLLHEKYYGWRSYYAADKTSLRKAIGSYNVLEIVKA
jgi:hypothetical protein